MAILDNDKHERFCKEYVKDLNAKKAYVRTYGNVTDRTAETNGSKLLRNTEVQHRISELQEKRAAKHDITADRVLMELANVAFANIGLVAEWDSEGKVTLKEKDEMGIGLHALSSIQSVDTYDKDGNHLSTKNKFTMHDKLKALELLSRHLGLLDGTGDDSKGKNKGAVAAAILGLIDRVKTKAENG